MRARVFAQEDRGNERDQAVAVDLFAVGSDRSRTVDVGIEDDAEVGFVFFHRLAHRAHRLLVFGVGDMVGERAVRFEELRTFCVRAQRSEHPIGVKPARAVARVDKDLLARKRFFACARRAHFLHEIGGVDLHVALFFERAARLAPHVGFCRKVQDLFNVFALESAFSQEELQTVLLIGQMARRDHHRGIRAESVLQEHEHRRRGGKPRFDDIAAA